MSEENINIMIVDDHAIVRQGMAMLIDSQPGLRTVLFAQNTHEACNILSTQSPEVEVLLIDISMDGTSGLDLLKTVSLKYPHIKSLVVSMHDEQLYATRALKAGARGYIMKHLASDKLIDAIRDVADGKLAMSEGLLKMRKESPQRESLLGRLTPTEMEVFNLIGQGYRTSEIAQILTRSVKTIEAHRANIKKKLDLDDSNELIKLAFQFNLIADAANTTAPTIES